MSTLKAIFFDQDGVIIDTEKDGHRIAFNEAFKAFGYDFEWDVEQYHRLLQISGGKERMRHYFHEKSLFGDLLKSEEDEFIKDLHGKKTEIFISLIESGKLPLRPGIKRIMKEAMAKGLKLGVCTTANERSAHAIARGILNEIEFEFVLAGEVVSKKKPDPEIYLLALRKSGLKPNQCIVVEDSRNGILAAKAAGLRVVATTNVYTEQEDLSDADIILTTLGDPGSEKGILKKGDKERLEFDGVLHVDQLMNYFSI
ncbi:MAG: HAD-IA family hydrolase [Deltaproteobacteria bacterium]|jgi:HAD superfamily hydrolase (TIGR01509 family)|nr:HAD-IA family hydrolase [Deltaproteobacteria bacterium]